MKHKRKTLVVVLSILLLLVVAGGCVWFFWGKNALAASKAPPVSVSAVSEIAGLDMGNNPRYAGVVEPQTTYKINKDESKTVSEVLVAEGDQVEVGTPLFRYDTDEMQLSLTEAEIALEGIANQISSLQSQKKDLETEKKNASKDDQYSYTVRIQSIELQIKTEEYNSTLKKSEIEKLKNSLQNAEVLSEYAGLIKEINTTPKMDSSGQQAPFISILSSGEYRVKGTISELNLQSLSQGQAVIVHSRTDAAATWQGVVDEIETEPATENNNAYFYGGMDSGTKSSKYTFYVLLENLEGLILGQHVYIEPDLGESGRKEGLWLSARYVSHDEGGSFVWASNENEKLEKRLVTLGDYDTDTDEYQITDGLTGKDFIAFPDDTLLEGMPTTKDGSPLGEALPPMDPGAFDGAGEMDPGMAEPLPDDGTVYPEGEAEPQEGEGAGDGTYTENYPEEGVDIIGGADAAVAIY